MKAEGPSHIQNSRPETTRGDQTRLQRTEAEAPEDHVWQRAAAGRGLWVRGRRRSCAAVSPGEVILMFGACVADGYEQTKLLLRGPSSVRCDRRLDASWSRIRSSPFLPIKLS